MGILTHGVRRSLVSFIVPNQKTDKCFSLTAFVLEDELSVDLCFPCGVLPALSFFQSGFFLKTLK